VQYSLQLLGQPFENSRTLLQCGAVPKGAGERIVEEDEEEDADDVYPFSPCAKLC